MAELGTHGTTGGGILVVGAQGLYDESGALWPVAALANHGVLVVTGDKVDDVAPGAAGGVLVSDGTDWVRGTLATSIAPTTAGYVMRSSDGAAWSAGAPTLTETGGPQILGVGAIPAAAIVMRTGTDLVGLSPGTAGYVARSDGSVWASAQLAHTDLSRTINTVANVAGSVAVDSGAAYVNSVRPWACAATDVVGMALVNTTAAIVGATIQRSPLLKLGGCVWDSDDAVSRTYDWGLQVRMGSGATVSSTLQFLSSLDGGAWTQRIYFTTAGAIVAANYVQGTTLYAAAGSIAIAEADAGTGLGSTAHLTCSDNVPIGMVSTSTSRDAANAVVFFSCYDRNAAALANAATIRLYSWGWTNDANAYTELVAVRGDGRLWSRGSTSAGDLGGLASTLTWTNATVAAGATPATLANAPAAAGQVGWIKAYVGTTAVAVPYWAAA